MFVFFPEYPFLFYSENSMPSLLGNVTPSLPQKLIQIYSVIFLLSLAMARAVYLSEAGPIRAR